MRRPHCWILGAVAAVALAGCGASTAHSKSAASDTTTTTVTRTATVPAATTAASTTSSSTTAQAATPTTSAPGQAVAECTSAGLAGAVGHGSGAAGTSYYQLELRNTSPGTCYEQGFAGVSLIDSSGRQIGAPADEVSAAEPKVVLSPGQTAYAALAVAEAGNYPSSCEMKPSVELRVYPPNQRASLTIAFRSQGCANSADKLLHIQPFTGRQH